MSCSNKPRHKPIHRRDVLRLGTAAVAAGALGLGPGVTDAAAALTSNPKPNTGPGHVVKVHMKGMRSGLFPDPKASRVMVDKAVSILSGETDPGRAWLRFIHPADRVLIKINCLGTRMLSSMREVVLAVTDGVRDAGVPDANILILDMFASNMMGGRFDQQPNPRKMRVLAHKESKYQSGWIQAGPAKARFSDLLLWSTAVINVPPIKDHDLAGVTCTMKNMTFGTIEKPHLNHPVVNEAVARLYAREEIRGRMRLNIVDGSRILYDGGPKFNGSSHALHECIYATTDPVAMDAVAHELIEGLRAENNLKTLAEVGRPAKFLAMAQDLGLGIADRADIHLETVELPSLPVETSA
jgi:uncharacterized protein (DUF362 family)